MVAYLENTANCHFGLASIYQYQRGAPLVPGAQRKVRVLGGRDGTPVRVPDGLPDGLVDGEMLGLMIGSLVPDGLVDGEMIKLIVGTLRPDGLADG
jgi:hypothetical protein